MNEAELTTCFILAAEYAVAGAELPPELVRDLEVAVKQVKKGGNE